MGCIARLGARTRAGLLVPFPPDSPGQWHLTAVFFMIPPSLLSKAGRLRSSLPIALPSTGKWFVRLIGSKNRFVFGEYRRHMKTIAYLGQIDKWFGVPATTRNWNTILAILRILKGQEIPGQ